MITGFVLVKIFACREHAEAFREGHLWANTLGHFRQLEGQDGQGDPGEGGLRIPDGAVLTLGDTPFVVGQDIRSVVFHSNLTDRVNVVCMFALHSGLLPDPNTLDLPDDQMEYRHVFKLPDSMSDDFGPHAVVVTDLKAFTERVNQSLKSLHSEGRCLLYRQGLVNYADTPPSFFDYMEDTETRVPPLAPVFVKGTYFRYQSEYRIAFDSGDNQEQVRILDIGDIHDITFALPTAVLKAELVFSRDEA
ncbi:MAG: hypothetical protein F4Y80_09545 [Caldilineaceae bacterium SB0665_bin_21]|nr:hypothetical protein [Caldilineaceae bacterium SB0665_bin_21]